MALRTADLSDEDRDGLRPCTLQLRSFGRRAAFSGTVSTVRCLDDNGLVRAVAVQPGGGRVLVVDGGGSLRTALVGDTVAALAVANGWAGIVVNGAVRDVAGLAVADLGVLAVGTCPRRGDRTGDGQVDIAVRFGEVVFNPGAMLYADEDGVLVEMGDTPVGF
jgi:regulator of ribonuclease activity A